MEYKVIVGKLGTFWYKPGTNIFHREGGPAMEYFNGDKAWYLEGKRHREEGPAVEWFNGSKEWYKEGKRHREDGPAVEWPNGDKFWYLEGREYTEEEYNKKMKEDDCDGKVVEIEGKKYQLKLI